MNKYKGYTIKIDFSEEDSCWFGVASDISRNHIIMEDGGYSRVRASQS